jgi:hypothetical protein
MRRAATGVTVTNVGGTSAENVVVQVTVGDVTRQVNLDLVPKATRNPGRPGTADAATSSAMFTEPSTATSLGKSDGQRREREPRIRRDTGSAYQNHA